MRYTTSPDPHRRRRPERVKSLCPRGQVRKSETRIGASIDLAIPSVKKSPSSFIRSEAASPLALLSLFTYESQPTSRFRRLLFPNTHRWSPTNAAQKGATRPASGSAYRSAPTSTAPGKNSHGTHLVGSTRDSPICFVSPGAPTGGHESVLVSSPLA